MPKVKNWDKIGENSWVNRVSKQRARKGGGKPSRVKVEKSRQGWRAVFDRPTNPRSKQFGTKEEAREKAIEWMRNNPSG